jgi:nitrate reductase assembly molybdenum cofactor insertion protein NarJ
MQATEQAGPLLAESARWRLTGLLFERPRPGWHEEVRALASEVGDERLAAAAHAARDADEGTYLAILGPGGAVSPREVAYRNMGDPGKILSELRGFYDAFGFHPKAEDPPDHVAVEAGFIGFVKLKQAFAAARGDTEGERTTREAAQVFVERHLGSFAGDLAERLNGMPDYLERAAAVLRQACPPPVPARPALHVLGGHALDDEDSDFPCSGDCGAPG